jgi:predicted lipoprotein with Yx(FWY)xxD motif/plastocyanin
MKTGLQLMLTSLACATALLALSCGGSSYGSKSKQTSLGSLSANDHGTKDVASETKLELEADSFYFSPTFLRGSPGQKLALTVSNESSTVHNFTASALSISKDVPAKGKVDVDLTFPQSGVVLFLCKYHTGSGMNGELLVGDAKPQAASSTNIEPSAAATSIVSSLSTAVSGVAPPAPAATAAASLATTLAGAIPPAPLATAAAALVPGLTGTASTVKIGNSSLGRVLTDAKGMTLYTSNRDTAGSGKSGVSGPVLAAWPAYMLASGSPVKPDGLSGDLSLITRDDGAMQVAYKGLPLYYWQNDKAPGDVTGQGVGGFSVAMP